jgi:hypothetical protein
MKGGTWLLVSHHVQAEPQTVLWVREALPLTSPVRFEQLVSPENAYPPLCDIP